MPSQVEYGNMALSELGITRYVSSISPSDGSKEADTLSLHFAPALDMALREIMPRFATKRKALALLGEELVTNWGYCYSYPTDCVRLHGIVSPSTRQPRLDESVPFEVANYNDARVVLTDEADAEIMYTARVDDTGLWDPQFGMAFVNLLASRVAVPLAHAELANNMLQSYYALAAQAWATSANESNPGVQPAGGFEASRS